MVVAVMTTIVVVVTVPRHSQHAFDAAFDAADDTADGAANHRTDRSGRTVTFGCAMLGTANNALSICRERHRKSGKNADGHDRTKFHVQTPCLSATFNLIFMSGIGHHPTWRACRQSALI
jgi:hypothetical protein